ncbi:hypothetical protein ABZP36_008114 [Zizania latifolia]
MGEFSAENIPATKGTPNERCLYPMARNQAVHKAKGFLPNIPSPLKYPAKILFCGWRHDIHHMMMVLEAFLAEGTELWMFNEVPEKERERKLIDYAMDIFGLTGITLVHKEGDAVIKWHLESLPLETLILFPNGQITYVLVFAIEFT